MAHPTKNERHIKNRELYRALLSGNENRVIELCKQVQNGPLHELTIHHDTVLHMATYGKQDELVLSLLREVPETENHMFLAAKNDIGNTILHDAATSNKLIPAAQEMLRRVPALLHERNRIGETALARAARYGKMEMFKFLDCEVKRTFMSDGKEEDGEEGHIDFYRREDKSTILHGAVYSEHFDLALYIAQEHECLVSARDEDGLTALQLLACNPSAFENGSKSYLKRLIKSCVSTEEASTTEEGESCFKVPLWEAIRGKNQKYQSAVRLAKFLIERDTSWEATETVLSTGISKTHKYGVASISSIQSVGKEHETETSHVTNKPNTAETALFLATKSGILEIVEEILNMYPQAVEHIDDEGRSILHVAIKYRQIHIFDFVEKMEIPMRRLIRKIDNDGNSILHMIGRKPNDHFDEDMRSPAMILQEDLLLFERVKKISTIHFTRHFNKKGQTADTVFAENNIEHRTEAKEWLKRTSENCSIVAVLISTVAFAAAYTVPGGPNESTGYPLLLDQPFFVIFALTDVLSLTFALTSVITFLSILTSSFRLSDFKQSLPQKLMLGITLLILSVSMMMLAFAATVILLIRNKQQWTRIALYSVAFFPVSIFALTYLPLYTQLMKSFAYTLKKIGVAFPLFNGGILRSWVAKSFRSGRNSKPSRSSAPQISHDHV
ncbi:ankyrin repeat-containing protein ITN1-like [Camellia sinensis]|uniref:ankyrin repeat-containing protein ITN1-like n=1 Tax=Camellia sinensis TaxID=4442 RepID=UPI001036877A|nr:ankyrin repeat-containing protein ITN1-like [Camellia sinensis]